MTTAQPPVPVSSDAPVVTRADRRRAVVSSFIGSSVEYYDFLLYAAAAGLVFPQAFFSKLDHDLGVLLSFVVLLVGYIARPVGGVIFGHFGDKVGRKRMLFITLMTMGLVSFGIGLMPTFATIGVAAPILLVVLRALQGLAVGGEWAGATLMSMEHSKERSKGFGASLAVAGGPSGAVLATLVLTIFSRVSGSKFVEPNGAYFVSDWGWRVPFLLSACIVLVGLYLRARVSESPEFLAARRRGDVQTGMPLVKLFRESPREVLLGSLAGAGSLAIQGLLAVFMVPYVVSTSDGAISRNQGLLMLTASNFLHIFAIPFFAWLSDRWGRRPVMLSGAVFSMVMIWPMFALFNSGRPALVFLGFILGNPIIQASMYGPIGAFLAEKFSPDQRYTGVSLTFQIGSVLGSGLLPLVAERLVTPEAGTDHLAVYLTVLLAISGLAVLLSREGQAGTVTGLPESSVRTVE